MTKPRDRTEPPSGGASRERSPALDRFLMLETARPAAPDAPHEHATDAMTSARFAAVGAELAAEAPAPTPPPAPAPPPVEIDPFAPPPIEALPSYEVESRDPGVARATLRCVECGLENARFAHDVCGRCRAPLDSRGARHLNEQLHQDELAAVYAAKRAADARAAELAAHPPAEAELDPVVSAPLFDRLAERVARGPAASWSQLAKRILLVALFTVVCGGLFALTGSPLLGFLLGLGVVLGLCMLPT